LAAIREMLKVQKQAQVQEEILKAAARLFADKGYRAVTIDDTAAEIGFGKSAIYYYFKNKEEVLWRIFEDIYDGYMAMARAVRAENLAPEEALSRLIYQHVLMVIQRREWTAIFFREESELSEERRRIIRRRKREYDAAMEEIYTDGVKAGVFRDVPAHIAVSGIVGMCNWLYVWFNEKGPVKPEEIAKYYVLLLADGYQIPKKKRR
jgi:AcrR family transcriptional regulator